MKLFSAILPILSRKKGSYLLGLFFLVLVNVVQLFIPKVIQHTIDSIEAHNITSSHILLAGGAIVALALGIVVFRYGWRVHIIGSAWFLEKELRRKYYRHLLTLSQSFYNRSRIGDLMALATNDINAVRMLFAMGVVSATDIAMMLVVTFILMSDINLKLSVMAIIPLPIMTIVSIYAGRRMHKRFRRVQESFAELSGNVQESIAGIRVIKGFTQEDDAVERMCVLGRDYVNENLKLSLIQGAFHPFLGFIISISQVIVLVGGGYDVISGKMTPGEFIAFFSYLGMIVWPVMAIGWFINIYQQGTASLKRINNILTEKSEIDDHGCDRAVTTVKGHLKARRLTFRYGPTLPEVLKDVSFDLPEGQTLAIVGRTGCGKTTLLDLLVRLYNAPHGTMYVDGNDITEIPVNVLREGIVTVPQDIFLFSETLRDNIRFGNPEADDNEVLRVAELARVHDDILGFSEGYDTMVGERGVTLSGGQKQRVAIARALLTDPPVLVLDDSLSAVDTKTEKSILDNLIELRQNRTTVIVAHRVSAVEHANLILVLDDGRIIEQGTHAELLALGGFYAELYEKQQLAEKLEQE